MFKRKKPKKNSGFLISLIFNLVLNFEMAVAAAALLVLHFTFDVPLFLFWIALALWVLPNVVSTLFLFLVSSLATPDAPRENKNPYSQGAKSSPQAIKPENKNPYSSNSSNLSK